MPRTLWRRFWRDKLLDQAAMLSFYFLLSVFPLLIFVLALLGLMLQSGQTLQMAIRSYVSKLAPPSASGLIDSTLSQIRAGSSSGTLSVGLLFSLWMATSGVVALMDGLNVAYEVEESRSWWRQRVVALALTVGSALFMVLALILLGYGDHLATLVAGQAAPRLGIVVTGWGAVKWLLVLGLVLLAFNLLYVFAPNVRHRRWHWLMPGTVLGVALWIAASYGFKLYLSFFNQYNATYGSVAAVIILLMWFYFTALAILLGGELNSAVEKHHHRVEKAPNPHSGWRASSRR